MTTMAAGPTRLNKAAFFRALHYEPHPGQREVHESRASRRILACGVRWGKSRAAAVEALAAAMEPKERSMGWICAPTYDLADKVFREIVVAATEHLRHRIVSLKDNEKRLVLRNMSGGQSEIRGKSADNPVSLLGEGLDWLIIDEAARLKPAIWEGYLSQRLIDKRGWALLISTPRGKGWFYDAFRRGQGQDPDYESWNYASKTNPYLDSALIEAERARLPERYGWGLPFNRLMKLEGNAGIPLPASTQWEVAEEAAREVEPVWRKLVEAAAQGEILHNDDTSMTVLSLSGGEDARKKALKSFEEAHPGAEERTGVFTTGIVSKVGENRVALYFTGMKHAGENLGDVVQARAQGLPLPIHMCDGLPLNVPKGFEALFANCLTHGRRNFVDVVESFPAEVEHVLESLKVVYRADALARERGMSNDERLELHKLESGPVMEKLEKWLVAQIEERKVEPNSGLGKAIAYMQKRWKKLTLFLRVPGAPLDNTIVERALKRAILHRKNSLFYKTENGARVGDTFMSLIQTAELAGVDPFDYLVELLRHPEELKAAPEEWLPWTYKLTLARLTEEAAQRAKG